MEHQFQTFSQWCAVDCAVPVDGADTQNVWLETSVARKLFTTERDRHSAIFTVFILSYSSFVEWHVQHLFNFFHWIQTFRLRWFEAKIECCQGSNRCIPSWDLVWLRDTGASSFWSKELCPESWPKVMCECPLIAAGKKTLTQFIVHWPVCDYFTYQKMSFEVHEGALHK